MTYFCLRLHDGIHGPAYVIHTEQYLLAALLANGSKFKTLFSNYYLGMEAT